MYDKAEYISTIHIILSVLFPEKPSTPKLDSNRICIKHTKSIENANFHRLRENIAKCQTLFTSRWLFYPQNSPKTRTKNTFNFPSDVWCAELQRILEIIAEKEWITEIITNRPICALCIFTQYPAIVILRVKSFVELHNPSSVYLR